MRDLLRPEQRRSPLHCKKISVFSIKSRKITRNMLYLIHLFLMTVFLGPVYGSSTLPREVADWSQHDVELWWNRTLFPEHVTLLRDYGVDGPTLLALPPEQSGIAFLPNHPLMAAKIQGHIMKLQQRCQCPQSPAHPTDLWSYADKNRHQVFRLGSAAMYLPRAALLYTNFFDHDVWHWLMNTPDVEADSDEPPQSSAVQVVLFWISTLFVPNLLVVYGALGGIWTNPIFITPLVVSLTLQQLSEYLLLFGLYVQLKASRAGKAAKPDPIGSAKMFFPPQCIIPLVAVILSFILPWFMCQVALWAMVGHAVLQCVAIVFTLAGGMFEPPVAPAGPAGAAGQEQKNQ